jgi:hypothetical protein
VQHIKRDDRVIRPLHRIAFAWIESPARGDRLVCPVHDTASLTKKPKLKEVRTGSCASKFVQRLRERCFWPARVAFNARISMLLCPAPAAKRGLMVQKQIGRRGRRVVVAVTHNVTGKRFKFAISLTMTSHPTNALTSCCVDDR